MLVSRVACIAKLQHKSIGYSGPLSRQLLCYRSLISEVRHALRNLIEVVLTGLLLSGDADRDRKDWTEMSIKYVTYYPQRKSETILILCLDYLLLMIMTAASESPSAPTWTISPCKQIPPHPRLGRRSSRRARNGSNIARASLETWIKLSSFGMP